MPSGNSVAPHSARATDECANSRLTAAAVLVRSRHGLRGWLVAAVLDGGRSRVRCSTERRRISSRAATGTRSSSARPPSSRSPLRPRRTLPTSARSHRGRCGSWPWRDPRPLCTVPSRRGSHRRSRRPPPSRRLRTSFLARAARGLTRSAVDPRLPKKHNRKGVHMRLSGFRGYLLVSVLVGFVSGIAGAATFTVTNTNDSGAGSLRQAILGRQRRARTRHDRLQHHRLGRPHDRPGLGPPDDHRCGHDRRLHAARGRRRTRTAPSSAPTRSS